MCPPARVSAQASWRGLSLRLLSVLNVQYPPSLPASIAPQQDWAAITHSSPPPHSCHSRLLQGYLTVHSAHIARLYGEQGSSIIDLLRKNPAVAVPVIVHRLRSKDAEWWVGIASCGAGLAIGRQCGAGGVVYSRQGGARLLTSRNLKSSEH